MGRCSAVRLFYALFLPPDAKKALRAVQERLLARWPEAVLSPEENLHMTLAFVGETPLDRIAEAREVLHHLPLAPIDLTLESVGRFHQRKGDVLWLGAGACSELEKLQQELVHQLRQTGFPLEERPFLPHVTLARKVPHLSDAGQLEGLLPEPIPVSFRRVGLIRSQLTSQGPLYSEVAGEQLLDTAF